MSGLVDYDAYRKAINNWEGSSMGMLQFTEEYEAAKLEKQKGSLPDWKHNTNCKHTADAKPALPELPEKKPETRVAEQSDINQLIDYLKAKELQERS